MNPVFELLEPRSRLPAKLILHRTRQSQPLIDELPVYGILSA